MHEQFHVETL